MVFKFGSRPLSRHKVDHFLLARALFRGTTRRALFREEADDDNLDNEKRDEEKSYHGYYYKKFTWAQHSHIYAPFVYSIGSLEKQGVRF